MDKKPGEATPEHKRRPRYPGTNPRAFQHKYKEHDPARFAGEVDKVLASGKTPAGMHRPIMVDEVLECLRPQPGEIAVDCTLGGGGHARAILARLRPGGRLIGLDVDPLELPRTEKQLRDAGHGPDTFTTHNVNFAGLPKVLSSEGISAADVILADLGVSSMQLDNPDRGFNYKEQGPLDMRMNPGRGERAQQVIARLSEAQLVRVLDENADEPYATVIASRLKQQRCQTTHELEREVRAVLTSPPLNLGKPDVKMSVRRTFQALRIVVNDEFASLDWFLKVLPGCLAPGGRVAILSFHSGEDRRVKKSFQAGLREGVYAAVARDVIRSSMEETRANRRASSAKLRWAVRSAG